MQVYLWYAFVQGNIGYPMGAQVYLERAEQLLAQGGGIERRMFLSTEDPDTVDFFSRQQPHWTLQYTEVPRKPNR